MTENADEDEFITATIGGQLFGLSILRVQDVFAPERITRVPLAAAEIAGVLNLRGRIVTLIDLRHRLGLGAREDDAQTMAIGVESQGESYGLLIDGVGEVLRLPRSGREPNPLNLDPKFAAVSAGIYRLEAQLLVVVDVDRALDIASTAIAA
jgi:purine-binding chemotaxis protein CheW